MGIIESRRQILSLLTYLTATLLIQDLTLSHIYNPLWLTGVDGSESDFFWRGSNSRVVLILQQLNKTLSKNTFLSWMMLQIMMSLGLTVDCCF